MSEMYLPQTGEKKTEFGAIRDYLAERGVHFSRWSASQTLSSEDSQESILKAYEHELGPYMKSVGFQAADVINVHPGTPNLEALRAKFMKEHVHTEDEARFFVDGEGTFWLHFETGEVAKLLCVRGDFLSVPKGMRHWFDLAPCYYVKAIRLFTDKEGWVAHYTESGMESRFETGAP